MRQLSTDLWEWDMPQHRVLGLQFGRRLTIARLADQSLWLHSPIEPTPQVVSAISALGSVSHIVGPNAFHDAYLAEAQATWPAASLHGAPGLSKANKKLRVEKVLTDTPDPSWAGTFDQHLMRGMPILNEIVFLHRASRTLIIADLAFNFGADRGTFSRLFFHLYGVQGRFKPSPLLRSVIKDRAAFRGSLEYVLTWDFDRVIVGHGANLETGGKEALRKAYAYLL